MLSVKWVWVLSCQLLHGGPPESNDIAIRKWQSVGLEWLIRRLIWTVARLQQSKNFNRRYLIGPCLHTFR
jgi:hypothetical protein